MPLKIDDLYSNVALAGLRDALSTTHKIEYVADKGPNWGSQIDGNNAQITFTDSPNPQESLAHELLHLALQKDGYQRMRYGTCSFTLDDKWFGNLISCLDNELQHQRMYPRYLELGFDASKFYGESAKEMRRYYNRLLQESNGDIRTVMTGYLSLVAPGGSLPEDERAEFIQRFNAIHKCSYAISLTQVDEALAAWRQQESLNAEDTARQIIRAMQTPSETFIGYGTLDEFPENGFFIDDVFTLEH